ncbi:MAG: RluA family pseudouridine synthase [Bacteroidota bacterium]
MMKAFDVIYEDNHIIVVNKASGILVQGDKTGDEPLSELVREYIRIKYKKPGNVFCGVVHRIDRPVSGLVILARTSKGLERMTKLFQEKKISKTYYALVENRPEQEEGRLIHWLVKDTRKNFTHAHEREVKNSKISDLAYKLTGKVSQQYLLEVKPGSGRPHQIRAQLAKMGCPIKGDVKYGFPNKNKDGNIHLHAHKLVFTHPIRKEPLTLTAPLPKDQVWQQVKQLVSD